MLILSNLDNIARKKLTSVSRSNFAKAKIDREVDREIRKYNTKNTITSINGDIANSPMQILIPAAVFAPEPSVNIGKNLIFCFLPWRRACFIQIQLFSIKVYNFVKKVPIFYSAPSARAIIPWKISFIKSSAKIFISPFTRHEGPPLPPLS